ncbi:dihydrofolate reductase [Geobacter sulfurreducens]|uniref:Dihydrofolate reductase n=1 Tax=Geobacter sulfurreducens (strain ATCC 51573 / DSM 12127 / PCA) TaxID=243231 RepID=Q74FN5_GEOSL|nr:dihydrofolate reductase [Geobacter sulfurreducens]AAR33902.1 dihydrofolate reductase [Geobacter sulfurreducens PCA]UAC04642.1 dihydrofolate reductase [Geobacter sulfurreducens]UTG93274.1 dihydrofolate reductase [Geobacter sulfurreducens]HCD96397.1 dihydrofolate reductase [Geobacter sulfurreducens]
MRITLIAAMAENRVIGNRGAIPWHLPDDLARFRAITLGHPVLMGRRTFESIGRPLPGRLNIVLSHREGYAPPGCLVARDLAAALELARDAAELFVCGGGELYREALPLADRILLTLVQGEFPGDVTFPEVPADFVETAREEGVGGPAHLFLTYERRKEAP